MKITDFLISIPPFISTTWDNVSSIHTQDSTLFITLQNNSTIAIPNLTEADIEHIFHAHSTYIETHKQTKEKNTSLEQFLKIQLLRGDQQPFSSLTMLQHDPAYRDLPPIPEEVANKLSMLGNFMSEQDMSAMPPSEQDCCCMYCQIHRLLSKKSYQPLQQLSSVDAETDSEIPILEDDLQFEQWHIEETPDQLYQVTNKLYPTEQHTVSLKHPVSCTCGISNCEHIIAVLRS